MATWKKKCTYLIHKIFYFTNKYRPFTRYEGAHGLRNAPLQFFLKNRDKVKGMDYKLLVSDVLLSLRGSTSEYNKKCDCFFNELMVPSSVPSVLLNEKVQK